MKTRIISGIVLFIIVAAVLAAGIFISPVIVSFFIALISANAVYELLKNAAGIKSNTALIGSMVYSFLNVFLLNWDYKNVPDFLNVSSPVDFNEIAHFRTSLILGTVYFIFAAVICLIKHKDFNLSQIAVLCAMPIAVSYAFSSLGTILNHDSGIYYLLLLINFSSVCDMGAYFTGVTIGKHKLCPEISPKKTVEGAVGGIISSIVISVVIILCFGQTGKMLITLLLTVPFCILGMIGDLFASVIKRSVGIKDYGNLIPGHGGILDRFDSILMIAPLLYIFIILGIL